MLPTAIAYMMMGSPYFLRKRLQLNLNVTQRKIYLSMFSAGVFIFILGVVNLIFPSEYWYIGFVSAIGAMAYYAIKTMEKWRIAIEVMDELEKMD